MPSGKKSLTPSLLSIAIRKLVALNSIPDSSTKGCTAHSSALPASTPGIFGLYELNRSNLIQSGFLLFGSIFVEAPGITKSPGRVSNPSISLSSALLELENLWEIKTPYLKGFDSR